MKVISPGKEGNRVIRTFKAAFKDAQPKIAALIIDRVSAEANKVFRTMAPFYTEGLNKADSVTLAEDGVTVKLGTKISQAMERGVGAYDLKRALLAKAKHFSKTGTPYVDVPFKHTTSGRAGTTQLPAEVKRAITARAAIQSTGNSATQVTRLPRKTQGKKFTRTLLKARPLGLGFRKVKQAVQHKRGLQDDLIRRRKKPRGASRGSTSYTTIRRISAKSSTSSWYHPGFKAAGLLKKTLPQLKPDIAAILKDSIAKVKRGNR